MVNICRSVFYYLRFAEKILNMPKVLLKRVVLYLELSHFILFFKNISVSLILEIKTELYKLFSCKQLQCTRMLQNVVSKMLCQFVFNFKDYDTISAHVPKRLYQFDSNLSSCNSRNVLCDSLCLVPV